MDYQRYVHIVCDVRINLGSKELRTNDNDSPPKLHNR